MPLSEDWYVYGVQELTNRDNGFVTINKVYLECEVVKTNSESLHHHAA